MPIADLLGVQFDMQLLGKLSLSVAAVLLISWAYKFYSSRGFTVHQDGSAQGNGKMVQQSHRDVSSGSCISCNSELRPRQKNLAEDAEEKSLVANKPDIQSKPRDTSPIKDPADESVIDKHSSALLSTGTNKWTVEENSSDSAQKTFTSSPLEFHEQSADCIPSGTLSPPAAKEQGRVSPAGVRSPLLLRKLEPGSGVGRELRQNLEHPGSYFSFQSKAEITVGDGDLLLGRPGGELMEVRGKIYDYYVESASQSISGDSAYHSTFLSPARRSCEDNVLQDSSFTLFPQDSELCYKDSRSPLSPVGLLPQSSGRQGHGLSRKESISQIVENSDLQIPFMEARASTPVNSEFDSRTDSSEDLCSSPDSLMFPEPSLEVIAGANFLQMPQDSIGTFELEGLKCKLDLGNCLQALSLARKYKRKDLQQAAFKVMSDNYFQVLRDPELYGRLKADERDQIQRLRMKGRRYLIVADMDPQDLMRPKLSKAETSRTSSMLYYYDDYKDTWHPLSSIPKEVISKGCAMCTMDNYLFIAVGCNGLERDLKPSKNVFCYNPVTGIWKEISPMNEARPHCKLVALQGYLYAIGGECLYTVERYDPRMDRWTFVAPLPNDTFAVAHKATACNGQLFVSGGTLRYSLLRYNPKTNSWKESLIVGTKERATEMVAIRNFIYRFDVNSSLGISVYRYHAMARLWYECCSKRLPCCAAFQCATIDDVIYCVNRQFTMRFLADEVSPAFVADDLKVLPMAKGVLFPFVLVLPEKGTLQTPV
ncbi:kelch domain-containing protein 7A [Lepisosteus oculatus]|uniref:kelch domain-containing protein 7A n=1 Tax=Lepisosteus oculatus TaxID=7918 RepID=UPI003720AF6A